MYNLDKIVKIYYRCVSIKRILEAQTLCERELLYENFPRDEFARLAKVYITQYSETENEQLYEYIQGSTREEGHPFAGMRNRSGLNVFAALEELAEQLLTMENNEVVCVYGNLLRLREVTREVEEDLLVCAYLAVHYRRTGRRHRNFGWNMTIGHNNVQLRRIMEKGISENHFHLFGSAPSFHLMWILFMNHVGDNGLYRFAKEVEDKQRVTREHYSLKYGEDPFVTRILKAALIRAHITLCFLMGEEREYPYDLERLLSGQEDVMDYYPDIQDTIDRLRNYTLMADMEETMDYALQMAGQTGEGEYRWAAGERWLMYRVLSDELTDEQERSLPKKYYEWFYAYLVIKQSVRSEIVQVNETVGFENFFTYDMRRRAYADLDKMIEAAVYGSVKSGNIRSLEIRTSPGESADDNARWLGRIDGVIREKEKLFPEINYYYVIHFVKQKDEPLEKRECFDGRRCRHYRKRRDLENQANALYLFRENYREIALKVLGIDACSQEIGCRPEVFAPIFRFLSEHIVEKVVGVMEVGQLKMTYHVGEDFLDVVDGLRAVDEAVHFLNLQCGDRIGHGTVLGVDVRKWYRFKQNTIVLPKQDYLDNVVWLYHKLTEYKIEGYDNLREKLLQEFDFYFAEIYHYCHGGTWRRDDCEAAEPRKLSRNIHTYYEAWKLRGDEPELYREGHFNRGEIFIGREWLVNRRFPEKYSRRLHDEIGYLYYLYHYDWDVRNNGQKSIQVYVSPMYVEGVAAVQKAMQRDFAAKGIGIEANPSSNLAISTIHDYAEHPIVQLYNKDLTEDAGQMRDCPQINISINTDDKGVFHTSLENEYALMACAMERLRDDREAPIYNRQMIYQWIDNIREMGNLQSFTERGEKPAEKETQGKASENAQSFQRI